MAVGSKGVNILFITADQLRADGLGCYGNEVVQTPNIDALAARGKCFDRVFTAYPVCAPNRAAIATGRYPSINGLRINGTCLPNTELTVMEVLRRRGYATYGAGKMHFGPQWKFPPNGGVLNDPPPQLAVDPQPSAGQWPWHGFERAVITEDNRIGPYGEYLAKHGYDVWADPHSFSYPQHQCVRSAYPEEHHQTTWIADRAIDYLREHDGAKPFFMWCSFVHPHHPFNPPAPFDTMYDPADMPAPLWREGEDERWPQAYQHKHTAASGSHEAIGMNTLSDEDWGRVRAFYYGMVSLIDKQVGRLMATLEARGMLKNTVVVFSADHGEMLGDHHLVFKGTTFDQVTRMPLIVARPGEQDGGSRHGALGCAIDLMPTMLELAGAQAPAGVQGASLMGAWEDEDFTPRDAVLIEDARPRRSVRTGTALLTWHGTGQRGELYDLRKDPHCFENLWGEAAARGLQEEMMDRLVGLMAANVDPLPPQEGAC